MAACVGTKGETAPGVSNDHLISPGKILPVKASAPSLNVLVTALAMIAVVFNISLYNGFQAQATRNMIRNGCGGRALPGS